MVFQAEALVELAGSTHWSARVEALEGLTALVGEGDMGGEGRCAGGMEAGKGCAVLESRTTVRHLEHVLVERVGDSHPKVAVTALQLLVTIMKLYPGPIVSHLPAVLSRVFPRLGDTKENVREAASRALDVSRAAYEPSQLCAMLCPRVMEMPAGNSREGLLEFLVAIIPHASGFLGNPGHLRAFVQRLAAALAHSSGHGLGAGGSFGAPDVVRTSGAASRALAALFHLDRKVFVAVVAPLQSNVVVLVKGALAVAVPDLGSLLVEHSHRGVVAGVHVNTPGTGGGSEGSDQHADGTTSPCQVEINGDGGPGGGKGRGSSSSHREPFAPISVVASDNIMSGREIVSVTHGDKVLKEACDEGTVEGEGIGRKGLLLPQEEEGAEAVARKLIAGLSTSTTPTSRKVEALALLRDLASGKGVGGQAAFWPRYFGQVLMLLIEGASAHSADPVRHRHECKQSRLLGQQPPRRLSGRTILRIKYLQGVRCLIAGQPGLFPGATEVSVGRLLELGEDWSKDVCLEAEAALGDLIPVLDPARFLAVLTPLLVLPSARGTENPGDGPLEGVRGLEREVELRRGMKQPVMHCAGLRTLVRLVPMLSSPILLGGLGAGMLVSALESAFLHQEMVARRCAVLAIVGMYEVLGDALRPFLANFPPVWLKLITIYVGKESAKKQQGAA
ncbi:unnamed protein product, partial [Choristocarpus tenellus]